jgi:hypothetical protein
MADDAVGVGVAIGPGSVERMSAFMRTRNMPPAASDGVAAAKISASARPAAIATAVNAANPRWLRIIPP